MLALLTVAMVGCTNLAPSAAMHLRAEASKSSLEASRPATVGAEQIVSPIAAFDFSQCGGALSLYVVVDQTHVLRFDPKQTTIFAVGPDGKMTESAGPPTPFEQAMQIANSAGITSNTIAPCDKPGSST